MQLSRFIQKDNVFFFSACFVFLLIFFALSSGIDMAVYPDTPGYIHLRKYDLFSGDYWHHLLGMRPAVVPFVFSLLSNKAVVIFHEFLFVLSLFFVAFQVQRYMESGKFQKLLVTLVLLFGLSANVVGWPKVILAESINISLLLIWIGLCFALLRNFSWVTTFFYILVSMLLIFSKDTNIYLIYFSRILITPFLVFRF